MELPGRAGGLKPNDRQVMEDFTPGPGIEGLAAELGDLLSNGEDRESFGPDADRVRKAFRRSLVYYSNHAVAFERYT